MAHPLVDGVYRILGANALRIEGAGSGRAVLRISEHAAAAAWVTRQLNVEEVTWYNHRVQELVPARLRARFQAAPAAGGGGPIGVGLPLYQNASANRRNAEVQWSRWIAPQNVIDEIGAIDPAVPTVLEMEYDMMPFVASDHFVIGVHFGDGGGLQFAPAHHARWTTFHAVSAGFRSTCLEIARREMRRRVYADTILPVGGVAGAWDQRADWYATQMTDVPIMWPWRIRVGPLGHAGVPVAGGWFPYYLRVFHQAPLWFQDLLSSWLQVYVHEEHYARSQKMLPKRARDDTQGLLSTLPFGLGCFRESLVRLGLLTDAEILALDSLLIREVQAASEAGATFSGMISLHDARRLITALCDQTAETEEARPLVVEIVYEAHERADEAMLSAPRETTVCKRVPLQRRLRIFLGRGIDSTVRAVGQVPHAPGFFRHARIGCYARHYFPLINTQHMMELPTEDIDALIPWRGIHPHGLSRWIHGTPEDRRSWTLGHRTFSMLLAQTSSQRATRVDLQPMDTFAFLKQIVTSVLAMESPAIRRLHLEPVRIASSGLLMKADATAQPMRLRTYESPTIPKMTKAMKTVDETKSKRKDNGERAADRRHFVIDYEDTSQQHEAYAVAVAAMGTTAEMSSHVDAPLTAMETWHQYFPPPEVAALYPGRRGDVFKTFILPRAGGTPTDLSPNAQRWLNSRTLREGAPAAWFDDGAYKYIPLSIDYGWSSGQLQSFTEILHRLPQFRTSAEKKFLRSAIPRSKEALVFAHNLSYDMHHAITDALAAGGTLDEDGFLAKDGKVITVRLWFPARNVRILLRDSWRLLGTTMSVAKMPDAFGFRRGVNEGVIRKEIFLHDWLADGSLWRRYPSPTAAIPLEELERAVEKVAESDLSLQCFDWAGFLESAAPWTHQGRVRLYEYACHYCVMDAKITAKALTIFQQRISDLSEGAVCALDCLSASTLADRLYQSKGCYERVHSLNGVLGEFFQSFVIGGRCTTGYGWSCMQTAPDADVLDIDARSLYPSAFTALVAEFGGLLQGDPIPIRPEAGFSTAEELLAGRWDGWFVQFDLLDAEAPPPIWYPLGLYPLHPARDGGPREDGGGLDGGPCGLTEDEEATAPTSLVWVNDLRKGRIKASRLYFDAVSFRDYLEHQPRYHPRDFRVLCGYGFRSGRNAKIGPVVSALYDERLKAKDAALKEVFKLVLNGGYGKLLQKSVPMSMRVLPDKLRMTQYVRRNFDHVRTICPFIGDRSSWFLVEVTRPFAASFSRPHLGAEVLSMARRLMNRLTCLLVPPSYLVSESNEAPPRPVDGLFPKGMGYYTDTDSFHISVADFLSVQRRFEEKYGTPMMGPALGQFHNDFGDDDAFVPGKVGIYLGKKMWCVTNFEGEPHKTVCALKGIPRAAMAWVAERATGNRRNLATGVFEPLLRGEAVRFPLSVTDSTTAGCEKPSFRIRRRLTGYLMTSGEAAKMQRVVQVCHQPLPKRGRARQPGETEGYRSHSV